MSDPQILTAETFAATRHELPDGGRWVELAEGRVVQLDPPDQAHGTTVLNLSKAVAEHLQQTARQQPGYACFDVGVIVARDPDSVRFPAMSYFRGGERFSELERPVAGQAPSLVVEIASTNLRRQNLRNRVLEYHNADVELVWIIDTVAKQTHVARKGGEAKRLAAHDSLWGDPVLAGFRIRVGDLFAEPAWWR